MRERLLPGASGLSVELRTLAAAPGSGFVFARRQTRELLVRAADCLEQAERELARFAERELAVADALVVATAAAQWIEDDARSRAVDTMTEAEQRRREVEAELRALEARREAIRTNLSEILQAAVGALESGPSALPSTPISLDGELHGLAARAE